VARRRWRADRAGGCLSRTGTRWRTGPNRASAHTLPLPSRRTRPDASRGRSGARSWSRAQPRRAHLPRTLPAPGDHGRRQEQPLAWRPRVMRSPSRATWGRGGKSAPAQRVHARAGRERAGGGQSSTISFIRPSRANFGCPPRQTSTLAKPNRVTLDLRRACTANFHPRGAQPRDVGSPPRQRGKPPRSRSSTPSCWIFAAPGAANFHDR